MAISPNIHNLLLTYTSTLLPIFLTTALLLALTMSLFSFLALHNPHVYAYNFGLPLPIIPPGKAQSHSDVPPTQGKHLQPFRTKHRSLH